MVIGVLKEIKNNENRVGLTPARVNVLVKNGHKVYIETQADLGSGFADEEYVKSGGNILYTKINLKYHDPTSLL